MKTFLKENWFKILAGIIIAVTVISAGMFLFKAGKLDSISSISANISKLLGKNEATNIPSSTSTLTSIPNSTTTKILEGIERLESSTTSTPESTANTNGIMNNEQIQQAIKQAIIAGSKKQTEDYKNKILKSINLNIEMVQVIIEYIRDEKITLNKKLEALQYINNLNKQFNISDTDFGKATIVYINLVKDYQGFLDSYLSKAEYQKTTLSTIKNDVIREEYLPKEAYSIYSDGLFNNATTIKKWVEEIGDGLNAYLKTAELADRALNNFIAYTPPSYSIPSYFNPSPQGNTISQYDLWQQTRALEDIATQLRGINYKLNYPF